MDPAVEVEPLSLAPAVLRALEEGLVLCYTGHSRVSGDIISAVMGAYRRGVPETTQALHRLKAIAGEMREALVQGDLMVFGRLLQENWENQQRLHPSVSNVEVETLFELALASGAVGGKALGAGGGGCLLFFCHPGSGESLRTALTGAGVQLMSFRFDFEGLCVEFLPLTYTGLLSARIGAWGQPGSTTSTR